MTTPAPDAAKQTGRKSFSGEVDRTYQTARPRRCITELQLAEACGYPNKQINVNKERSDGSSVISGSNKT